MRCCFHHDREAVGQCEDCKVFLCPECINESRKTITNMTLCRVCVINAIRKKRDSAKSDKTLFKIGAVVGVIVVIAIVCAFIFGFPTFMRLVEDSGLDSSAISLAGPMFTLFALLLLGFGLLIGPYSYGAGFVGIKKTIMWCWRSTIKIIPLTAAAALILILLSLFILAAGSIIGFFVTPYWLHKGKKFLRETAWVETLPESAYTYPPPPTPPPYQPTQTTNTAANFCRNCGKPTAPNATFCIHCGKQI